MDERLIVELTEQIRETQIETLVVMDALALLIARLTTVGVIDQEFLGDMVVCAEGIDEGRCRRLDEQAPAALANELTSIRTAVAERRATFMAMVEQFTANYVDGRQP
ncbi:hypothetical protein [Sphingomonas carotinifaciens]|uniref:Uncharacterized protein n=1 Tax=Sphingomonas carotinifaciens TaxID=1166323 RepID=A0A1G7PVX5_9SPHN|nr:hypothetical protein [Sphingomonas carotinifaciens]MBB4087533.1 hypothetical protein [Sphingomonas carotinifaciens]MWC45619.1 hypothetical protein [Sphingomonas carotinifaciens]SDF90467.1 hypothetical protein SAMN05216557_107107 [Sphingomonas carotinifaciens]